MGTSVRWSSKWAFIFAASAAAIGLGNVWRFPYLVGQNGGGAFVILYLICVAALGLPLLYLEVVLGRVTRKNPMAALRELAAQSGASLRWSWLGAATLLTAFLIMTYYVVIVGWVLDYVFRASMGHFSHMTAAISHQEFKSLQHNPGRMLLSDTAVVLSSLAIVYLGIKKGLERAVLIMFPALAALMLLLLIYAMCSGAFLKTLAYLFIPHFSLITPKVVLLALGQAFFSLNVAMGVTMMFSAYLPEGVSLIQCSISVAMADTGFALLAGLIIFPTVFHQHLTPGVGPSLIFQTLPVAFGQIPWGSFIGTLFFIMLFFAAFSSVISLLEPVTCLLSEELRWSRRRSVLIVGVSCWLLSLLTIGSFSTPSSFSIEGITFFKMIDFFTASIMLPIGGILLALFGGWVLNKKILQTQLGLRLHGIPYQLWNLILRYIAPVVVLFILLTSFGLF